MNEWEGRDERRCYFHPSEMVVGVCSLCLNERLLLLASKQPTNSTPKIFALTTFFTPHHKSEVYDSTEQDSFISIKFEENGVASWDKGNNSKISHDKRCDEIRSDHKTMKIKSLIEHAKRCTVLRWRRRIDHLLQVIKWKRSSKDNVCHVGTKLEGKKIKYGWIRILTKRRTKE